MESNDDISNQVTIHRTVTLPGWLQIVNLILAILGLIISRYYSKKYAYNLTLCFGFDSEYFSLWILILILIDFQKKKIGREDDYACGSAAQTLRKAKLTNTRPNLVVDLLAIYNRYYTHSFLYVSNIYIVF